MVGEVPYARAAIQTNKKANWGARLECRLAPLAWSVKSTDPISYGRPQAAKTYVEEIQKVTKAPIKYLICSHHHYDHIAGGKPFKDADAVVIAHKRAKERLAVLKGLDVVIPDETVDNKRTIALGAPHSSCTTPAATIPIPRW
jgi:glyoxylase-like metal-dependent hydrolase (beta-lactamase superfamily II)